MTKHYIQLVQTNEQLNAAAVHAGCAEYRAFMDVKTEGLPAMLLPFSVVMAPLRLVQLWRDLNSYHLQAEIRAIVIFKNQRCTRRVENDDMYYQRLKNVCIPT